MASFRLTNHLIGRYLVGGTSSGLVCIWDVQNKKLLKQWADHTDAVTALQFSPEDSHVVSGEDPFTTFRYSYLHTTTTIRFCLRRHHHSLSKHKTGSRDSIWLFYKTGDATWTSAFLSQTLPLS